MSKDARDREPYRAFGVDHDEFDNEFSDRDLDYEEDEFGFEEFGCVFGDRCCMPGFHFRLECYTPEMAEEWYAAEEEEKEQVARDNPTHR